MEVCDEVGDSSDNPLEGDDPKKEVCRDFDFSFHGWRLARPLGSHVVFSRLALGQHQCVSGIFRLNRNKAGRVSSNSHTSEWPTVVKSSLQFSLVTIVSKITCINLAVHWTGIMMHFEILG